MLLGVFFLLLRARIRQPFVLLVPVIAVWLAILASGIHATVAGILVALMVPMKSPIPPQRFVEIVRNRLPELERDSVTRESVLLEEEQLDTVLQLYEAAAGVRPPGLTLERLLHPVQAYLVLPLFAVFNAGITLDARVLAGVTGAISVGVILGLVVGKPLGLMLLSWLAVRSGLTSLPADLSWGAIFGVGWLAGIGFTMSLFVSALAFKGGPALEQAKMGILVGSLVAGVTGTASCGGRCPRRHRARARRHRSAPWSSYRPSCSSASRSGSLEILTAPSKGRSSVMIRKIAAASEKAQSSNVANTVPSKRAKRPNPLNRIVNQDARITRKASGMVLPRCANIEPAHQPDVQRHPQRLGPQRALCVGLRRQRLDRVVEPFASRRGFRRRRLQAQPRPPFDAACRRRPGGAVPRSLRLGSVVGQEPVDQDDLGGHPPGIRCPGCRRRSWPW